MCWLLPLCVLQVLSLDQIVHEDDSFVSVGSRTVGLMNPILIVARPGEPLLNLTMHAMLRRYRHTAYQYLDWSSCRNLFDAMAELFEADTLARGVWRKHIRGGVVKTARGGLLYGVRASDENRSGEASDTSFGRYRILTSMQPGARRDALMRQHNNASLQRVGNMAPWTFAGNALALYDKWHSSIWELGGRKWTGRKWQTSNWSAGFSDRAWGRPPRAGPL
jgi:hypothetical protein